MAPPLHLQHPRSMTYWRVADCVGRCSGATLLDGAGGRRSWLCAMAAGESLRRSIAAVMRTVFKKRTEGSSFKNLN
jgi:hypothetical protein